MQLIMSHHPARTVLLLAITMAAGPAYGHDDEKAERIAAGLQDTPAEYQPLNVEWVGQLALGVDLDIPTPVRTTQGNLITADLFVAGDHAYVGSWAEVLHIVDISDPAHMWEVARVPMPGPALDVKIHGDLAVVGVQRSGTDFGVVIVDIADPTRPVVLAEFSEPGWRGVHNLFVHGERAYLAHTASPGMTILDISDPSDPFVSGFWSSPDFSNVIHDISIRDGLGLVSSFAENDGGLVILSLDDPDNPETLSGMKFSTGLHSAWLEEGYVYCNQEFGGWNQFLRIVDVRDPRNPVLEKSFRAQGPPDAAVLGPHNPFARDGLLYWAYYDAGLRVFDLSDPARPVQTGYYPTALAWGAHPHDDGLVYVADSIQGLIALRYTADTPDMPTAITNGTPQPEAFSLGQNHPNPFNGGTQIKYSIAESGQVTLTVYNLAGQRVSELFSGFVGAGSHQLAWDGKDAAGKSVASGVYVYQLIQGERSRVRRLMLMK